MGFIPMVVGVLLIISARASGAFWFIFILGLLAVGKGIYFLCCCPGGLSRLRIGRIDSGASSWSCWEWSSCRGCREMARAFFPHTETKPASILSQLFPQLTQASSMIPGYSVHSSPDTAAPGT
jgi:hypothetical protein